MDFGLILPNFGPRASAQSLFATAQAAERLGFHSLWATDHILLPEQDSERFGHLYEAFITLAVLAGVTQRVRLGVSCLVLPLRDPMLVAKQVAALDALSGGRAMLCVCAGWSQGEFVNLGQPFHERGRRLDEAIAVLRALWRSEGEPVDFDGRFFRFRNAVFSPRPRQPGGPPLWVGGNSPAALRRAARLGDGWHATGLDAATMAERAARLHEQVVERPFTLSVRVHLSFDGSNPLARLVGAPQEMAETLQAYRDAGLDLLAIQFPGESQAELKAAMGRFMEDVVPLLDR